MRAPSEMAEIVETAESSTKSVDLDERREDRDLKLTHSLWLSYWSCKVNCFIEELTGDWSSSWTHIVSLTQLWYIKYHHCIAMPDSTTGRIMLRLAGTGQP